jgi:hypothetical protein
MSFLVALRLVDEHLLPADGQNDLRDLLLEHEVRWPSASVISRERAAVSMVR